MEMFFEMKCVDEIARILGWIPKSVHSENKWAVFFFKNMLYLYPSPQAAWTTEKHHDEFKSQDLVEISLAYEEILQNKLGNLEFQWEMYL